MKKSTSLRPALFVLLFALGAAPGGAQHQSTPPAVPTEAIGAILEAFRSHPVVALGEGLHGNEQGHALRLALLRDHRFAAIVNDIVVESGSATYQDLMDRFVRGDDIPDAALQHVWQDTTQISGVWDRPIYEEFFRAVRALNVSLSRERQIRVLLGDPPIDWDNVLRGTEDLGRAVLDRDRHAAEVIQREVLAKKRRALVVYGDAHLFRAGQSLVSLLERTAGIRIFTIATAMSTRLTDVTVLQPDVLSWHVPSMASVRGTLLDAKQFKYYDAVLYLGPASAMTFVGLPAKLCADPQYIEMRLQRAPPGALADMRRQIERLCATHAPR